MSRSRTFVAVILVGAAASLAMDGGATARPRRHVHPRRYDRSYTFDQGRTGAEVAAGTALGLLGVGIAGATTVSPGYGYGYTPGLGYFGSGYQGPGFAYPGY